ncbi:MAG: hypothetical protein EA397_11780 [Deltaproteobacteria bacterium]|nr:MAG: hypothetical protein EA397_11780 [Deltaproteobacteria bacterium]
MYRALTALALLSACSADHAGGDFVGFDWAEGDTFYVGASYRVANIRNEEGAIASLDDTLPSFDESWSQQVVWAYQVVDSGLIPSASDELYDYAVRSDGSVAPLAVVRAYVDRVHNDQNELSEVDPVVYLVFREDRDRLAAIIQFTNVEGERIEKAWSTQELGRSWSALSQSMLTAAPTYLAPFATPFDDGDLTLENGSRVSTRAESDDLVDATFPDELGGGMVHARFERGLPWATETRTDNVHAYLLDEGELSRIRRQLPPPPDSEPPPNYDFRRALASTINIDSALQLDEQTLGGGFDAQAPTGYRPWAGNWWPLRTAEMTLGWQGDSLSKLHYDEFQPMKSELEAIGDELRNLEGEDRSAKIEEYRELQSEYVDALVDFYNQILQDLAGGRIVIEEGTISHTEDEWSFVIDELSPTDKYAVHMYLDGQRSPNPFFISAWELLNRWAANHSLDNSWFGHCNGWAAAAILEDEPREAITVTAGDGVEITYETADLKALTSELHYMTYSRFYGERYNDEDDDINDLYPKPFHQIVSFYIRDQQVPIVFDTDPGPPVWNFPAWGVDISADETTEGEIMLNINTATRRELMALPGIGEVLADRIIESRELEGPFQDTADVTRVQGIGSGRYSDIAERITVDAQQRTFDVRATVRYTTDNVGVTHIDTDIDNPRGFSETYRYTLVTDMNGLVVDGEWHDERNHPDFAWIPYNNPLGVVHQSSENPFLVYRDYLNKVVDLRRE